MDEKTILEWKEANAELYSKFKHDLEEQLQKPYHQTILDISDGNAEPLQSVVLNLTAVASKDDFDIEKLCSKAIETGDTTTYCLCYYLLYDNGTEKLLKTIFEKAEEPGTQEILEAIRDYKRLYNRNRHQETAEITSDALNLMTLRRWHYDHREQYAEFTTIFQNAYNGDMTFFKYNTLFLIEMLSFVGVKGMIKIVARLFPGNKYYEQGLMDTDDNPLKHGLKEMFKSSLDNDVIRERLLHRNPYLYSFYYWIIFENGFLHAADLISHKFLKKDNPNWEKQIGRKAIESLIGTSIDKAYYSKTKWKEVVKKSEKGDTRQVIETALLEEKGRRGRMITILLLEEMLPTEYVPILTIAIEKELSEWKQTEKSDTILAYIFAALVKGKLTNDEYNYRTFHFAMREKFPNYNINKGFDWTEATYNAIMSETNDGNINISAAQIQRGRKLATDIKLRFLSAINPNIK